MSVIRVELTGGLANQLFQWAAGEVLAREFRAHVTYETREVDRPDGYGRGEQISGLVSGLDFARPSRATTSGWKLLGRIAGPKGVGFGKRVSRAMHSRPVSVDTYREARVRLANGRRPVRLRGLFQDVDDFAQYRDLLSARISMPDTGSDQDFAVVHVRRGDYVANPKYAATFGICSEAYYLRSLSEIAPSLPVKIVSDDPVWCEDFVRRNRIENAEVISGAGRTHFDDLAMIASASQIVMSNSTFSWWGAFLSSADVVYSPDPWFSDAARDRGLALSTWVKIPRD